jgi:hypothetical protein
MKKLVQPLMLSVFTLAAALLLPLAQAMGAELSEMQTTFSDTLQSQLVRGAIDAMNSGNLTKFRESLSDRALDLYGSPEGMRSLQQQFTRQSTGTSSLETRSDRKGQWSGDRFVLLSRRVYSIDVLGRRGEGLDPIWNVSVQCYGLSLTESFGGANAHCRISELSMSARGATGQSVAATSTPAVDAGTHSKVLKMEAGEASLNPAPPASVTPTVSANPARGTGL